MLVDVLTNYVIGYVYDTNDTIYSFPSKIRINNITINNKNIYSSVAVTCYSNISNTEYLVKDGENINIVTEHIRIYFNGSTVKPDINIYSDVTLEEYLNDEVLLSNIMKQSNLYNIQNKFNNSDFKDLFENYLNLIGE